MKSYTFCWNEKTWKGRSDLVRTGHIFIDYIAGEDKRPFSQFAEGDEVFIVRIKDGNLYLGGCLVVGSKPMRQHEAAARLGSPNLIKKKLYLLAKRDRLDHFRPSLLVDLDKAIALHLLPVDGVCKTPRLVRETGLIYGQEFRVPYRLKKDSADVLRSYLTVEQR